MAGIDLTDEEVAKIIEGVEVVSALKDDDARTTAMEKLLRYQLANDPLWREEFRRRLSSMLEDMLRQMLYGFSLKDAP